MEKINAGIFNSPQIRQLMKDSHFASQMTEKESAVWTAFMLVIKNFLESYKASNYIELVSNINTNAVQAPDSFSVIWLVKSKILILAVA